MTNDSKQQYQCQWGAACVGQLKHFSNGSHIICVFTDWKLTRQRRQPAHCRSSQSLYRTPGVAASVLSTWTQYEQCLLTHLPRERWDFEPDIELTRPARHPRCWGPPSTPGAALAKYAQAVLYNRMIRR